MTVSLSFASVLMAAVVAAGLVAQPSLDVRAAAAVDGDSDGDLDVVTAHFATNGLGLRRNNGNGTFAAMTAVSLSAGALGPTELAVGDLDGDGRFDDVAVACQGSDQVVLVLNAGAASPVTAPLAAGGSHPRHLAAGALDVGSVADIVIALEGDATGAGAGISLIKNAAAAVAISIPGGHPQRAVRVALGDLDGDQDGDLVALVLGGTGVADELLLFTNDGTASFTFADALILPTSGTASGGCVRDLDVDGARDIAVVVPNPLPTPTNTLRVFRFTGTPPLDASDFTPFDVATPGSGAIETGCGDLEGDGRGDVVVVNGTSGNVWAHLGFRSNGTFLGGSSVAAGTGPIDVALGDLNGDRTTDIVIANQGSGDVTITLTPVNALAIPIGTGCAGTSGRVPAVAAVGLPTSGNPAFGVRVTNARTFAPAVLLFATTPRTQVLGGGCSLYLQAPLSQLVAVTDPFGVATVTFGVPSTGSSIGVNLYFQWAILDPNGAYAALFAFSDELRIRVGS